VGKAVDIYSINGNTVTAADSVGTVASFQQRLDHVPRARENFGPAHIHKSRKPYCTSGSADCKDLIKKHKNHVHFSVD
jgi:hypothetical protein